MTRVSVVVVVVAVAATAMEERSTGVVDIGPNGTRLRKTGDRRFSYGVKIKFDRITSRRDVGREFGLLSQAPTAVARSAAHVQLPDLARFAVLVTDTCH